jgi:hypothetical protein
MRTYHPAEVTNLFIPLLSLIQCGYTAAGRVFLPKDKSLWLGLWSVVLVTRVSEPNVSLSEAFLIKLF